jgi:hypothetical protein
MQIEAYWENMCHSARYKQDKALGEALDKVASNTRGSQNVEFLGSNNCGFQLGYNSGSISGFTFGKSS